MPERPDSFYGNLLRQGASGLRMVALADVVEAVASMSALPTHDQNRNIQISSPKSAPSKDFPECSLTVTKDIDIQDPVGSDPDVSDHTERWVKSAPSICSDSVTRIPRNLPSRRPSPLLSKRASTTPCSVVSNDNYDSEDDDSDDGISLTKMDYANWERTKQRMKKLRTDPEVLFFSRNNVYCNRGCGQIVSLDFRRQYYPDAWNKHKRHCDRSNHPLLHVEESKKRRSNKDFDSWRRSWHDSHRKPCGGVSPSVLSCKSFSCVPLPVKRQFKSRL